MYNVDIKIYEPLNPDELPFHASPEMIRANKSSEGDPGARLESVVIKPGYYSLKMFHSEEELDQFYEWCHQRGGIIKILGSEPVPD